MRLLSPALYMWLLTVVAECLLSGHNNLGENHRESKTTAAWKHAEQIGVPSVSVCCRQSV